MAWPQPQKTTKHTTMKPMLQTAQAFGPQALESPRKARLLAVALGLLLGLSPAWGQPLPNPTHPHDQSTYAGVANVILSVVLDRVEGTPRFQWFHNQIEVPGQTSSSLVLTNLQPADAGTYYAAVTDDSGIWVNTRVATVTVDATFIAMRGGCVRTTAPILEPTLGRHRGLSPRRDVLAEGFQFVGRRLRPRRVDRPRQRLPE